MPQFIWYSSGSLKQARTTKGNIAARAFNDKGLVFWTCSIWEDEKQMMDYIKTGIHKKAMPYLQKWCNEARTGHSIISGSSFPTANEMKNILLEKGRPSKLNLPNENHLKGVLPDPVFIV